MNVKVRVWQKQNMELNLSGHSSNEIDFTDGALKVPVSEKTDALH